MQTHIPVVLVAMLTGAGVVPAVQAQCVPSMRGFSTGPLDVGDPSYQRSFVTTLMPFEDGSGSAIIAAGQFNLAPSASTQVAKYQNGHWTPMALPSGSQLVVALAVQDFSSVGGPARSIYAMPQDGRAHRWTGSAWEMIGTRQTSIPHSLLSTTDDQGPVLLMSRTHDVNSAAPRVLAWRGSGDWTAYGTALNNGVVYRIRTIDDGSGPATIAVGSFSDNTRGIKNIAKFVNGEWAPVPFPDSGSYGISDITAYDDGAHGSELYVSAMYFDDSGPLIKETARVFRLRGGAWAPVEAGEVSIVGYSPLPALLKLDDGSGERLHLAGYLRSGQQSGLVQLTSSGWQAPIYLRGPDSSIPGAVFAGARYEEGGVARTFLAGDFQGFASSSVTWASNSNRAYGLVQSDSGAPLGYTTTALGLGEFSPGSSSSRSYCLSSLDLPEGPRLLMTGGFSRAGGVRAIGAAMFDGLSFAPLNVGTSSAILQDAIYVPFNGESRILAAAPDSSLGPVAYWNGSQWQRLSQQPTGSTIRKLASFNNEPIALMSSNVSVYRNGSWQALASITQGYTGVTGDLGEGKRFYFSGTGASGVGVYQFDGQSVTLLGTTPNLVVTMTIHDDGSGPRLYVGGAIPSGVARFNGGTLEALAGGNIQLQGGSLSLASYDDGFGPALYAAGGFSAAGGHNVNGLARWRNNQWEPVVPYVPPVPSNYRMGRTGFAVFNDRLVLAGDFTSIGAVNADHLAFIDPCPVTCSADYNHDGDFGTDLDIEAFFACLGGNCCTRCTSDFDNDGDFGTDADIEAFFRVLAGGAC